MDLTPLNTAIDGAFAVALAQMPNPQRVAPQAIAPNVTLQTDTYEAPTGSGFRVVCRVRVPEANFTATRVRNHGPDSASERDWPVEGIVSAARAHVAACMTAAGQHMARAGLTDLRPTALLRRYAQALASGTLEAKPKLAAMNAWVDEVEGTALQGRTNFPAPPHTFEEVMAE
jgi:hypothetical protein